MTTKPNDMKKLIRWFLVFLATMAVCAPNRTWAVGACTCARFNDFKDHGCHKTVAGVAAPPTGVNNAGGDNASCPTCPPPNGPSPAGPDFTGPDASGASTGALGMPRWWVDEPYINLHIMDEPLSYTTSSGQKMAFQWIYKQRYMLPQYDQIPNLLYTLGYDRLQIDYGFYVYQMRSYGGADGFWLGMTNAAWSHSWMMDIVYWDLSYETAYHNAKVISPNNTPSYQPYCDSYEALLFAPDDGIDYFTYNAGNGTLDASTQLTDPISQVQLTSFPHSYPDLTNTTPPDANGIYWGSTTNGLMLLYPDGSKDIFSLGVWLGPNLTTFIDTTAHALLTQRIDPEGRVTLLGCRSVFFTNSCDNPSGSFYNIFLLAYVVDSDNHTNKFIYNTNTGSPWQLQEVDDPFGRKATFSYEPCTGWIASITDANGMSNSFNYQSGSNGWISSLITPYGTTSFNYAQVGESDVTNGYQQRANYVTEPDGASQLYAYIHNTSNTMESTATPPSVSGFVFDDGTNGNVEQALYHRNSFYWDRRQTPNLSTYSELPSDLSGAISNLTTADLHKGRMQHWLLDDADYVSVTETLSSERDPSPDAGGTIEGNRTWYGYAGAPSTNADVLITPQIGCIAQILPGGSTQYMTYSYYSSGLVENTVQSYSLSNGSIGQFTNSFSYAANAIDLTNINNSLGQYVNIGYNTNHEPVSITNALNQVTTLGYDSGTHNLTSVALFNGQTIGLTYYGSPTAFLNQITLQPEDKTSTIVAYSGPLPQIVHVTGTGLPDLWLTNIWDNLNRLTQTTYQDGTTISNTYTYLDLTAHKDRLGNWTYYAYDGLQHLTSTTDARGSITQFTWCDCGALTSISNALGNITSLNYNNQELLTNLNFPDGSSMNWQYDLIGRVTNSFDGSGVSQRYAYNNQSLVTAISNAYGQVLGVYYDAVGRPITATNINNVVVTNSYDLLNRLTNRAWTGGGTEEFGYATNGLIAYTNQDGEWTLFGRDGAGRMTAMTNAVQTSFFSYNALDELSSLTDGLNHTTTWIYNQYGWLTSKTNTLGTNMVTYSYDADGHVTGRAMSGTNTSYTYDPVGNLTSIIYPQLTVSNQYDAVNELTNMTDGVGTTKFTYTATGQLSSETAPWTNNTISKMYSQGRRTNLSLSQPSGSWSQAYAYDAEWRMTNITSPAGAFDYSYTTPNPASALISGLTLPNGASIANSYDSLARLTDTSLNNYWGHTLDGYLYGLDPLGLRTNMTRELGITTNAVRITYDGINQLTEWFGTEANGLDRLNDYLECGYDAAGNIGIRIGSDYIYLYFDVDSDNELTNVDIQPDEQPMLITGSTSVPATNATVNGFRAQPSSGTYGDFTFAWYAATGQSQYTVVAQNPYGLSATNTFTYNISPYPEWVELQYDANGNLTNDSTRVFSYDAENQLTNVFATNAWRVGFIYDGLKRRRIERDYTWQSGNWLETNETRFIYDGRLAVQERNTNNNPQVTYTRGLDLSLSLQGAGGIGGLLARTDSNGPAYYHADGSGNITSLMDGNENIVARYEYTGFGKMIGKWGALGDANHYRFSSKESTPQAGIYYYGYRFYDPNLQRWLNRDPVGEAGGINMYEFVGNAPLNNVDPLGLQVPTPVNIAIGISQPAGLSVDEWNSQFQGASQQSLALSVGLLTGVATGGLADAGLVGTGLMAPGIASGFSMSALAGLAADAATQATSIALGNQQNFDAGQLAVAGATSGVLGGAAAGVAKAVSEPCPTAKPKAAPNAPKATPLTTDQAKRITDAFNKGLDEKFKTGGGVDEMRLVLKENGLTDEQIAGIFQDINKYIKR
jgi:RHS repeat-associated protein